jgi:hypothetical protein
MENTSRFVCRAHTKGAAGVRMLIAIAAWLTTRALSPRALRVNLLKPWCT